MSTSFAELLRLNRGNCKVPKRLLCLDPGETTGWALFENGELTRWGQIPTVKNEIIYWDILDVLFTSTDPDYVVCEDYRIYQHKLARHSFSPVLTLRLIGGIDMKCTHGWFRAQLNPSYPEHCTCPIHYQMATTAKTFCTDERLKQWDFWQENMRHARDAIRHGCYFLLFYNKGKDII